MIKHILIWSRQWSEFVVLLQHGRQIKSGNCHNRLIEKCWIVNSDVELRSKDVLRLNSVTAHKVKSVKIKMHLSFTQMFPLVPKPTVQIQEGQGDGQRKKLSQQKSTRRFERVGLSGHIHTVSQQLTYGTLA